MKIFLITPVSDSMDKFAGDSELKIDGIKCPIPFPQPQSLWWKALTKLGHEVEVFLYRSADWPALPVPTSIARLAIKHNARLQRFASAAAMYLQDLPPIRHFNRAILQKVIELKPDVVLISGGVYALHPQTVNEFRTRRIKTVLFNGTCPLTQHHRNEIKMAEHLDLICVNDPAHVAEWTLCGAKSVVALPVSACDPDFHQKLSNDDPRIAKFKSEVSFVGSFGPRISYGTQRIDALHAVADLGLAIYTNDAETIKDIPELHSCVKGTAKQTDIPYIINATKININILARTMPTGGNYRTFEIAGCGGFQLCDNFLGSWFDNDREIVRFVDPTDLRRKTIFFLEHAEEREKIASAGFSRSLKEHTYTHRMKHFIEILEGI